MKPPMNTGPSTNAKILRQPARTCPSWFSPQRRGVRRESIFLPLFPLGPLRLCDEIFGVAVGSVFVVVSHCADELPGRHRIFDAVYERGLIGPRKIAFFNSHLRTLG